MRYGKRARVGSKEEKSLKQKQLTRWTLDARARRRERGGGAAAGGVRLRAAAALPLPPPPPPPSRGSKACISILN